jgi:hypothetical protein
MKTSKHREATFSLLQKALDFAKNLTSEERSVLRRLTLKLVLLASGSTAVFHFVKWLIA